MERLIEGNHAVAQNPRFPPRRRGEGDRAKVWTLTGEASVVRRSDERGNILVTLEEAEEPMSPSDLSHVTGMKNGNIRRLLHALAKAGEVRKSGRGQYIHPKNAV
ncbi:helix-turn-helix domain-containing protein [Mesorhizobium sp. IMUNJ 23033]|uniref:helix-turn-helix domain-containing protein n=1 Tax=Mesorhizobium sp. IMUNJ 23033 TaxID=3378039 RepID=UPI00385126A9